MEMSSCRVFVCVFFFGAHSFTSLHKDTRYMFFCSKVFCFGEFWKWQFEFVRGKMYTSVCASVHEEIGLPDDVEVHRFAE